MTRRRQKPIDYIAPTGKPSNDQYSVSVGELMDYVVVVGRVLTEILNEGDPAGVVDRVVAECRRLNGAEHAHRVIMAMWRRKMSRKGRAR